jgi:hypothetical protein
MTISADAAMLHRFWSASPAKMSSMPGRNPMLFPAFPVLIVMIYLYVPEQIYARILSAGLRPINDAFDVDQGSAGIFNDQDVVT